MRKEPLPLIDPREYEVSGPQAFDFGNAWGMAWRNPRTGFRHAWRAIGTSNPLELRAAVHEHLGLPAPTVIRQGTGERFAVLPQA